MMSSLLQTNIANLQELLEQVNNLPEAGGQQETPVISVNSTNGLITATAGTKSTTHQLAFQAAKTITPSTVSQIAVSSGYYTGGNIMVAGDANLVAANIVSGKNIFGVSGTAEVGSGGSGETVVDDVSRAIITRTVTEISDDEVETIGSNAFAYCSKLTTASFPAATTISSDAFANCSKLTTVSFPAATTIDNFAFRSCFNLTTASFPAATTIGNYAFAYCSNLTTASFPAATTISGEAFANCFKLTTVSFPAATTIGSNAFAYCFNLTTASFPAATTIGNSAFANCSKLTTASFPAATTIGIYAFAYCSKLTTVSFPAATTIGNSVFRNCSKLTTASFPAATTISNSAFRNCSKLTTFILAGSSVPTLNNSNAFSYTSMSTTGYFYVPSSLIASYQAATNWTYFSSRFSAVEDYEGWDGVYGNGT